MWKCSKCEAMVEDTEKLCPVCGEACPEEEANEEAEELTTPVAEETEKVEITEEIEEAEEIEEDYEDVVTFDDEPLVWVCETCGAECDGEHYSARSDGRPQG